MYDVITYYISILTYNKFTCHRSAYRECFQYQRIGLIMHVADLFTTACGVPVAQVPRAVIILTSCTGRTARDTRAGWVNVEAFPVAYVRNCGFLSMMQVVQCLVWRVTQRLAVAVAGQVPRPSYEVTSDSINKTLRCDGIIVLKSQERFTSQKKDVYH